MPSLSVIIPTHKRADILGKCLEHLSKQTIAKDLDVIVVSDGHDDATAAMFPAKGDAKSVPKDLTVRLLEVPKSQQGAARNAGVEVAHTPHCLFIGDDIFLFPDACEKHLKAHETLEEKSLAAQQVVLGYTTWDPQVGITRVMRWLESSGWQFAYNHIARFAHEYLPTNTQHLYCYTSNISLPTAMARAYPFLANISLYGWEDIEWGMRLHSAGIRVYYEPDARAWHHHTMTLKDSLQRMETLGRAAVDMERRVPGFDRVPRDLKLVGYQLAALMPTLAGRHRRAFLKGMGKL